MYGATAAERTESIKQMLIGDPFYMDESEAYTWAYDFRKRYSAKY